MAHRGHESGMDFEYQNTTGPMDARSPFAQFAAQHPPMRRFPSTPTRSKRPGEDSFGESNRSPGKQIPAFNSLYNTPRKVTHDIDDSSAGETPRSTAADSDATPDHMALRSAVARFDLSSKPSAAAASSRSREHSSTSQHSSPTKDQPRPSPTKALPPLPAPIIRNDSFFNRIKSKLYSPGRGEIPRADYTSAMEKRVRKRRDREIHRHVARRRRHSMSESGEDESETSRRSRSSPRKPSNTTTSNPQDNPPQPTWLASTFTFIASHPTVPHILSFYAQLLFNIFLLSGCAYLLYCFCAAVQGDVDKKSHEAMIDIMAEMAACAEQYTTNKCDRHTRAPALETLCENWHRCMQRDPERVGRAKVSAHTFAEIFNSFVEPISWKAMIFTCLLVFGCFATTNMAFAFFRDKAAQAAQAPGMHAYYPPPPQTPQHRSFSGPVEGNPALGCYSNANTPWLQHQQPALEPMPSGNPYASQQGSPVRRLAY